MTKLARWRGLGWLVVEAVEQGSRAVERIQLETARHRFGILAHVPVLATAAGVVHQVHDAAVTAVHASVRGVSRNADHLALGKIVRG